MFSEDCKSKGFAEDPEYVLIQPAVQIVITCSDTSVTDPPIVLDFPERKLTRADVDPKWLALHDAAEQKAGQQ